MSAKPKLLFVGDGLANAGPLADQLHQSFEVVQVQNPLRALGRLRANHLLVSTSAANIWETPSRSASCCKTSRFWKACPTGSSCSTRQHDHLGQRPAARVDRARQRGRRRTFTPCWAAPRFWGPISALSTRPWPPARPPVRRFAVRRQPLLPGACRAGVDETGCPPQHLIVTVRDVTSEIHQQQKTGRHSPGGHGTGRPDARRAVRDGGRRADRAAEDRTSCTSRATCCISTWSKSACSTRRPASSSRCWPWAWIPRPPAASCYAQPQNNGVTGFVAATGKSYLCEDTTEDPLYLEGVQGREKFADRAAGLARRSDRHVQRRKPRAAGLHRKRPAVSGDLQPRRGRGAQHAGTARGRKGHHGRGKRRGDPQRRGPAGRRNPQRRRERHGALHRPRAGSGRAAASASCATPATSSR